MKVPYIYKATVCYVVDGDTIDVIVDLGFKVMTKKRLRLARINTPERGYTGYQEAKDYLTKNYLGKNLKLRSSKTGKYGRWIAEIYDEDGESINQKMLDLGLGVRY